MFRLSRTNPARVLLGGTVLVTVVATCLPNENLLADEGILAPSQIRAAMLSERSKIVSGSFVANGRHSKSALGKVERSTKFNWKYEFDLVRKSFLFDRLESVPANPDTRGSDSELLRIFFCEDTESRYTYEDYIVPIARVNKQGRNDSSKKLGHQFKRLNVTGLGFSNCEPFLELTQKGDRLFFEHKVAPSIFDGIKVERESQDIVRLWDEFSTGGPVWKLCLWVDIKNGFTPVRRVAYLNGQIESDSNTDWEFVNDTWVPRRLTGRSSVPFLPEGKELTKENIEFRSSEFELDISWTDVNKFVGPAVYDFKEFQFAKGTQLVEAGEAIHVYGYELPSEPEVASSQMSRTYLVAMSLLVCISLLFFGVRLIRTKN